MHPSLDIRSLFALTVAASVAGCSEKQMRQDSSSMEPTIKRGEVLTVDTKAYSSSGPSRWDVVIFDSPLGSGGHWASRVVGLPGESVDIRFGKLIVDGREKALPAGLTMGDYRPPSNDLATNAPGPVVLPFKVPAESFFVLGDNVSNALDSRYWGALDRSKILGKVPGK